MNPREELDGVTVIIPSLDPDTRLGEDRRKNLFFMRFVRGKADNFGRAAADINTDDNAHTVSFPPQGAAFLVVLESPRYSCIGLSISKGSIAVSPPAILTTSLSTFTNSL